VGNNICYERASPIAPAPVLRGWPRAAHAPMVPPQNAAGGP